MEPATLKNTLKNMVKIIEKDDKIKLLLVGLTFQGLGPPGSAGLW